MKVTDCYPFKDNDGMWCLVYAVDGHHNIVKKVWSTKQEAIEYGRKRGWIYP